MISEPPTQPTCRLGQFLRCTRRLFVVFVSTDTPWDIKLFLFGLGADTGLLSAYRVIGTKWANIVKASTSPALGCVLGLLLLTVPPGLVPTYLPR